MDSAIEYGQNVAAITALFYEDGALSSHVQEVLEQKICGDVELWEILATGGLVFTQQEAAYTAGVDFMWFDAIEDFVRMLMRELASGNIPKDEAFCKMAWEAIGNNSVPSEVCFGAEASIPPSVSP